MQKEIFNFKISRIRFSKSFNIILWKREASDIPLNNFIKTLMLVGIVYRIAHVLAINEAYFEHSRPLCGVSYDDDDGDEAIQSAALWQQRQRPPQQLTKRRSTAAPTAQLQRHSTLLAACCKANALTAPAANAATARPEPEP